MLHLLVGCEILQSGQNIGSGVLLPIQEKNFNPTRDELKVKATSSFGYDFISLVRKENLITFRTYDFDKILSIMGNGFFYVLPDNKFIHFYVGEASSIPANGLLYKINSYSYMKAIHPLLFIDNITGNINEPLEININCRGAEIQVISLNQEINFGYMHSNIYTLKSIGIFQGEGENKQLVGTLEARNINISFNLDFYDHYNGSIEPAFSMIKGANPEATATVLYKDLFLNAGNLIEEPITGEVVISLNKFERYGTFTPSGATITLKEAFINISGQSDRIDDISTGDIRILFNNIEFNGFNS